MVLAWLLVLVGALIVMAYAEREDELADDPDEMRWIDYLADMSKRRCRRPRSRYSKSGIQKAPRRWNGARQR